MTNQANRVLYVGVSSDLVKRVNEHKHGVGSAFTSKYKVNKLVFYEVSDDIQNAIAREKQVKSWKRARKVALIGAMDPGWKDLSTEI